MVSVNAGLLVGPDLTIDNPYLKGAAEMYESGLFVTVDLNYLVEAHICVFQDLSSYGRYICFNHVINTNDDAADLARKLTSLPPGLVPFFFFFFFYLVFHYFLLFIIYYLFFNYVDLQRRAAICEGDSTENKQQEAEQIVDEF